jgi:thymidylate synthase
MNNFEQQYVESLKSLLNNPLKSIDERGNKMFKKHHQYFKIDVNIDDFPLLNAKKVFPKLALKELVWFLIGSNDVNKLNEFGVNYWNDWKNSEGTIGKSYGYQFLNFNGINQVENIINTLINKPTSRRNIINLWNVGDLKEMELPPCVINYQFSVDGYDNYNLIDLHILQRSADSFLGIPYDIMIASWFLLLVTEFLSITNPIKRYVPNHIHYTCNDYHLYTEHLPQINEYLENWKTFNTESVFKSNKTKVFMNFDYPFMFDNKIDDYNKFKLLLDEIIESKFKIINTDYDCHFNQIKAPIIK